MHSFCGGEGQVLQRKSGLWSAYDVNTEGMGSSKKLNNRSNKEWTHVERKPKAKLTFAIEVKTVSLLQFLIYSVAISQHQLTDEQTRGAVASPLVQLSICRRCFAPRNVIIRVVETPEIVTPQSRVLLSPLSNKTAANFATYRQRRVLELITVSRSRRFVSVLSFMSPLRQWWRPCRQSVSVTKTTLGDISVHRKYLLRPIYKRLNYRRQTCATLCGSWNVRITQTEDRVSAWEALSATAAFYSAACIVLYAHRCNTFNYREKSMRCSVSHIQHLLRTIFVVFSHSDFHRATPRQRGICCGPVFVLPSVTNWCSCKTARRIGPRKQRYTIRSKVYRPDTQTNTHRTHSTSTTQTTELIGHSRLF